MIREIACPRCTARFAVDDALRGREVRCRQCDMSFVYRPWEHAAAPQPGPVASPSRGASPSRPRWVKLAVAIGGLGILLLITLPVVGLLLLLRMGERASQKAADDFVREQMEAAAEANADPPGPGFAAAPGVLEVGQRQADAPAQAAPASQTADKITVALDRLRSPDIFSQSQAAADLALTAPVPDRRTEVVKALKAVVDGPNASAPRAVCIRALTVWGARDDVPYLLSLLDHRDGAAREAAITALGKLKDERAAPSLADRLANATERGRASQALKEIGTAAEPAVRGQLRHADPNVRAEACRILEAIGTRDSYPALKKSVEDPDDRVSQAARNALPPDERPPLYGPHDTMTLAVHVRNPQAWPALEARIRALADSSRSTLKVTTSGSYKWVRLAPVQGDATTFARKITFGKVVAVHNSQRLIYVDPERR